MDDDLIFGSNSVEIWFDQILIRSFKLFPILGVHVHLQQSNRRLRVRRTDKNCPQNRFSFSLLHEIGSARIWSLDWRAKGKPPEHPAVWRCMLSEGAHEEAGPVRAQPWAEELRLWRSDLLWGGTCGGGLRRQGHLGRSCKAKAAHRFKAVGLCEARLPENL